MTQSARKFLVGAILVFHTAWVAFVCLAWVFIFWFPKFNYWYFGAMLLTAAVDKTLPECPLTSVEKSFIAKINSSQVYQGTCIGYYAKQWFGWNVTGRVMRLIFIPLLLLSLTMLIIQIFKR